MDKLQQAAFDIFISHVKGAKGSANSLSDILKEYGFTGPFAGLDKFYADRWELENDLEKYIK